MFYDQKALQFFGSDIHFDLQSSCETSRFNQKIVFTPLFFKETVRVGEACGVKRNSKKQRFKEKSHMSNVKVGVVDAATLKVCIHVSNIKVRINRHDQTYW